jgi:hypothetical protein
MARAMLRRTIGLTLGAALLAGPGGSAFGQAPTQPFNQPPVFDTPGAGAPSPQGIDPPSLVGRVARIDGVVSFHDGGQAPWQAAALNYPVTSGTAFWTQPGAGAALEAGAARIVMDQSTELGIDRLDEGALQASLTQGRVAVDDRDAGLSVVVQLPGVIATLSAPAHAVLDAGPGRPITVSVLAGTVQLSGVGSAVAVQAGQMATIDAGAITLGPLQRDAFVLAQQPPPPPIARAPAVLEQMTGGEALANVGEWSPDPELGEVWYPPVAADWVPYREGNWAWVAPWGWTWVDAAPWGFAPFHYGRWQQFGPRWGWVPGRFDRRPAYAPALVGFIGFGAAAGIAAGRVGWVPLGPREAYRPSYRASTTYLTRINNFGPRVANTTINNIYVNRQATTVVQASAMRLSEPVGRHIEHLPAQALAAGRPSFQPNVRPTAMTLGVSPTVARQLSLPPNGSARPVAPGPERHLQLGAPMQRPAMPAGIAAPLVRPGVEPAARPGQGFAPRLPEASRPPVTAFRPQAAPEIRRPVANPMPAVAPPMPVRPQPRPEMPRPDIRAQPSFQPRPQPPRAEYRPQPQAAPRMEPRPQFQQPEQRRPEPAMQRSPPPQQHEAPRHACPPGTPRC